MTKTNHTVQFQRRGVATNGHKIQGGTVWLIIKDETGKTLFETSGAENLIADLVRVAAAQSHTETIAIIHNLGLNP